MKVLDAGIAMFPLRMQKYDCEFQRTTARTIAALIAACSVEFRMY